MTLNRANVSHYSRVAIAVLGWIVGGFHQGSYNKDRIRYTGMLGCADINLKCFGLGDEGEKYNIQGVVFNQEGNYSPLPPKKSLAGFFDSPFS